ncbi:VCBS domain-containing protein [Vibrio superstes]|uniref:Cadherin domain-containing protein n=1 Tax=Vibrio superstes NBRC 103154 TaxID=1219062 RepID=A0A511QVD9_9VIBR|nr:VCBS domain-containing protein [Vibrio superstes]GEM81341.1 hypothetical protein VSU01S_35860 [Vibrio superstes NBRC 103154]
MSGKNKQKKDGETVIKNSETKAAHKDLSAKTGNSKRTVKKERETKKKQIYIPLGFTLSLVLPSFRKAEADEADSSSAIAPVESHSKTSNTILQPATATEHKISASSPVQQNIMPTADLQDNHSNHSQAHSSNYSHHPVISHPFMNVGYEVATTHAPDLQGYQTSTPNQSTANIVSYREETLTGKYGTLTVGPDGHYAFNLNPKSPAFILLQGHEVGTDSFVIHLSNGLQQTITVPVSGNNEAAQFSGDLTGAVTEDLNVSSNGLITTQGTLSVSDQDHDQDTLVAVNHQATKYGEFSIDESGHWQYQVNNASNTVQALSSGQMLQETITVHSVDGTEQQIVVTINGQDDSAVISGNDLGHVIEDKQTQVSGKLDVIDPDASQQHFQGGDLAGTLGTLHLQDNGAWTYDLDNTNPKVQALGQNGTATDIITVQSADGTTHKVTITVNGTNDKAIVAGADTGAVTEESQLKTSGTLTVTDVDTGEAHFSNTDIAGSLGTLHLTDSGAWTYDLDNTNPKVQALGQNGTATDIITVQSADGTTHKVSITVNGSNDRPVISGVSSGSVIEQGNNTLGTPDTSGVLTATDIDKPDTITWAVNQPHGQFGTLSIDQHGHWHYQLDNSTGSEADKLAAGEHRSESFWVTATDSAGASVPQKIVIDVQGSNDKPVVSAWTQLPAGKEDQPVTIKASDLLTHTSDVDTTDTLHVSNLQATHGSLTDNKDGTYTFTPDKDFNGEIRLTYDVVDGHGGSVITQAKFDLTATPDKAIITDAETNADLRCVTEDRGYIDTHYQLHYDGKLNIRDADTGEAQFDPNIGSQTYQGIGYDTKLGGHVVLMPDGHYTYTLDNRNIQNLAQGEVKHDSAVIRSVDGTTHTIELTVHGTNDTPIINAQSHSVTEGGSVLQGQMVGYDVDTGASLTYNAPQVDGLVVNPDGTYSFNPNHSSYQSLASGITKTLTIPVTVTDEHNASSTQNLSITITGVNNSATVSGVDTGDVNEGYGTFGDRSPDYAQAGMAKIGQGALTADGKLDIVDPDTGESQFDSKGGAWNNSYHGQYGHLLLNTDGTWHYDVPVGSVDWVGNRKTTVGTTIDKLGEGQTLTDTITIQSKDGTTHDIVITIHGDNDRPYCSSEVQLSSGKEDLIQTITSTELLANTVDVDANDLGMLTIANLHADHGSIKDNHDGTFTFTPSHNYNGSVHFTYDVKDAHGGTTHTGANTTLVATPDKAIISEVTTESVIEDGPHATHNNGTTTELANGQLQVIDPDSGEDKFQYSQFGETRIHDPFGGMLRIDSAGNWGYSVDNAALQHLAQGQVETVTYRVHSFDGTAYDLNIDVIGTNDAPTVTKVVLSNGTEDTHYQMQASQFGFTDVDTGDTLHSIAITDLPPTAQGKFVLDGHDITAGQSITTADIAKLQFIPTPDFNGDVQFKFTVNDGHVDSQEATNTLHIDAVSDAAQFTGRDTGDVHEGHTYTAPDGTMSGGSVDDRSPDHMHGNIGKLWNDEIHTDGHLNIVDPDSGESHAQTGTYQGTHGHVILQSNGDWSYYASIGQDATGRKIDHLGQGESITDTVTVKSADGTTHDIHITIHGDNDRPYCSSEVQLNSGKEDLSKTITTTELLANTVDVDTNDVGQLSIANLHADHGTLVDNKDGTFTFTPDHNYNGQVHFTYDVKDAHGGVTHTGASSTLLPSNDAATLPTAQATTSVTEDHLKSGTSSNELWSGWKNLDIQDIDSPSEAKVTQIEVNGVKHTVPADFAMNLAGTHGTFNFTHSTDGHNKWSYSADNSHTEIQGLSHGESLTDTITLITADGTRIPLTAKILGTDDHVVIDTPDALTAALGTAVEDKVTSISGTLLAHDSDSKDSVTFTTGDSAGSYGTLHVDSNGQWHYDLDHSKANALQQGETKAEGFDITAISTDGSTATKHIEVLVQGTNDKATISVTSNPDVHEDSSSTPVEIISGKVSALDPDHDQSAFSTDVGKRHDPFNSGVHGGLHISKDGSWTYTVNNSQIQQLAAGQEEHVLYNVHTVGGDDHIIDIKIVGTNDRPTISATTLAHGTENVHYQMQSSQFGFTDIDTGDTLHSISITDLPPATQGKFVLDGNNITSGQSITATDITKLQFIPAHGFSGDVHFKFTVNDWHEDSLSASNTITIDSVNHDPIASPLTDTVKEDASSNHPLDLLQGATDADGDTLSIANLSFQIDGGTTTSALPAGISLASDGHTLVVNAHHQAFQHLGVNQSETIVVSYTVKDGQGGTVPQTATLTVTGTNDAPSLQVHQITHVTGTLTGNDIDGDALAYSASSLTGQFGSLTLDTTSGHYVYTPDAQPHGLTYDPSNNNYSGQDTFEVKVSDGHSGESSKFITFGVVASVAAPLTSTGQPTISTSVPHAPSITNTQPPHTTSTNSQNAVSLELSPSSDSGQQGDLITSDNTPTVNGHALIPFSQVDIIESGKVIATTHADANGDYHVDLPGLNDATHTLIASATDPLSASTQQSQPLAVVIDTVATLSVDPISGDNMLTGSEHTQSFSVSGAVTGVEDGQAIHVQIEHHTYQGQVSGGKWHVSIPTTEAQALTGGIHNIAVSVTDKAGNHATMDSPLFVSDGSIAPPIPTIATPHISGGGGIGSHLTGNLVAPPLLQQLHPQTGSGWGILAPNGMVVTRLQGQYGALVIDPKTGHVDYQYSSAPTPGQKASGGSHWAGSGTHEQHHDVFQIMYHDTHSSNVDVKVNLDVTYIHGHSGQNQASTHLVGMSVTPVAPTVQHDEPDSAPEVIEVTLYADDDSTHHDLMAGLTALADDHSSAGSNPYTDIVGLHDAPQTDASAAPAPEPAPDLDLLFNQADDLAHQHPVDAFIDNNGEEHKPDDHHVLDDEHIQQDLPDVMDLPDHHH